MEIGYVIAGAIVGVLVGFTGIGGGALMTPMLILGFGVPVVTAVSTDLAYAAITKLAGSVAYARQRLVAWRVVILLLCGSVPGSLFALHYLSAAEDLESQVALVNLILGISLVLTSVVLCLRGKIQRWQAARQADTDNTVQPVTGVGLKDLILIASGFVLGGLVTLSSIGAGALGTALLILLFPRMSMRKIVGTDLAHAVVLTAVAGSGHYSLGNLDFVLLGYLLLGSLPGVVLGSQLAKYLSSAVLQPVIAVLLFGIGVRFMLV
ncbi:sulfite exporter TauE/SafE family protein [Aliamphritea spongicola]|uniref:sulfite exporter TauE/SafE family protein n=1 Tax=Aliamphritea spongicola TaxID=707589 RepID=UPI00196ACEE4|nr:sulfite exporter TauE/SafE family protein [Aliamphritea spongicola]MBN3564445.1 sulfite exporter TauE/SafE family protein [Aliamphritea spongicola]